MIAFEEIKDEIKSSIRVQVTGNYIAVTTQCLYPSNSAVTVYITAGKNECTVTDNGEAYRVVTSHGLDIKNSKRWLSMFTKPYGIMNNEYSIFVSSVPLTSLIQAITLVANASAEAAHYAIRKVP